MSTFCQNEFDMKYIFATLILLSALLCFSTDLVQANTPMLTNDNIAQNSTYESDSSSQKNQSISSSVNSNSEQISTTVIILMSVIIICVALLSICVYYIRRISRKYLAEFKEKRTTQTKVLRLERQYDRLSENLPIGLYRNLPAENGRFIMVNTSLVEILGYDSKEELLKVSVSDIYQDKDKRIGFIRKIYSDRRVYREELSLRKKDGSTICAHVTASFSYSSDGEVIDGIIEDVTQYKKTEKALRQSQKMEAIGRLAGGIAHDFNNILTVINGYSELLLTSMLNKRDSNYMRQIHEAGIRASQMTRQLLAFSRQELIKPETININELIDVSFTMLRRLIPEDIRLELKLSKNLNNIDADVGQIEQILMNLVINAKDAINENKSDAVKRILIETDSISLSNSFVKEFDGCESDEFILITVSDTGMGMSKEVKDRIFEPFFTTKEVGRGTGLGLATIYGIVKQNKGFVTCYSEINHGTTFKILWPVSKKVIKINKTEIEEMHYGRKETVLVVEDDSFVRELITQMLIDLNYNVLAAADISEVDVIIENPQCKIDILLTDVILPEENGRVLADRLLMQIPDLKVIFTSGYSREHATLKKVLENDIEFISKPFSINTLSDSLFKLMFSKESD